MPSPGRTVSPASASTELENLTKYRGFGWAGLGRSFPIRGLLHTDERLDQKHLPEDGFMSEKGWDHHPI